MMSALIALQPSLPQAARMKPGTTDGFCRYRESGSIVCTIDRVNPPCILQTEPIHRVSGSPKVIPLSPDRP